MTVTFFGHTCIPYEQEEILLEKVYAILESLIKSNEKIKFYLGAYGRFSNLALKCCKRLKKERDNVEIYYVTPYLSQSHFERCAGWIRECDSSIYPPLEKVPLRYAIIERNKWMIKNSDFVICFVDYPGSNAVKFLEYTHNIKKPYANVGRYEIAK